MAHSSFSRHPIFYTENELAREQQQSTSFKPGDVVMLVDKISEILGHPYRHQQYGSEHLRQVHDVLDSVPGDFNIVGVGLCAGRSNLISTKEKGVERHYLARLEIHFQPPTAGHNAMRVKTIESAPIHIPGVQPVPEDEQRDVIYEQLSHALLALQATSPLGRGITGYRAHRAGDSDGTTFRYHDVLRMVIDGLKTPYTTVFVTTGGVTQSTQVLVDSELIPRPTTTTTLALATLAHETSPSGWRPDASVAGIQMDRVRDAISAIQRVIDAVPYGMGHVGDLDTDFRVKEYPAVGQAVREVREYLDETVNDTCMHVLAEFDDEVSIAAIRDRGDLRVRLDMPCGHINLRPYC